MLASKWIDLANDDGTYPSCNCGAEDAIIVVETCLYPDCDFCLLTGRLLHSRFRCPTCYVRDELRQVRLPSELMLKHGRFVKRGHKVKHA